MKSAIMNALLLSSQLVWGQEGDDGLPRKQYAMCEVMSGGATAEGIDGTLLLLQKNGKPMKVQGILQDLGESDAADGSKKARRYMSINEISGSCNEADIG